MDTIALPIQIANGRMTLIPDNTDEYFAHLISMVIQIEPGELPLTPEFGCFSPVFDDEQISNLALTVNQFIPEVDIDDIEIVQSDSGKTEIQLSFSRNDGDAL